MVMTRMMESDHESDDSAPLSLDAQTQYQLSVVFAVLMPAILSLSLCRQAVRSWVCSSSPRVTVLTQRDFVRQGILVDCRPLENR